MVQYQNPYLVNPYLPLYNQGQPVMPQAMQYQQPVDGIVKVNGRESAMQYQLPPNSTSPALFDQSGTCFYVVSTDGTGTKSIECFDFCRSCQRNGSRYSLMRPWHGSSNAMPSRS